LVTSVDVEDGGDAATVDLRALLSRREGEGVSISLPATPVLLQRQLAFELDAAVGNALDNVRAHAGAGARAYLLLEDLDDVVAVSIRDDGVGIAVGRLAEAAGQGHMGISKSIVGRLESLGGSAQLRTDMGAGTEWELTVPRRGGRRG
jgi:signal transduction histidine kinase